MLFGAFELLQCDWTDSGLGYALSVPENFLEAQINIFLFVSPAAFVKTSTTGEIL